MCDQDTHHDEIIVFCLNASIPVLYSVNVATFCEKTAVTDSVSMSQHGLKIICVRQWLMLLDVRCSSLNSKDLVSEDVRHSEEDRETSFNNRTRLIFAALVKPPSLGERLVHSLFVHYCGKEWEFVDAVAAFLQTISTVQFCSHCNIDFISHIVKFPVTKCFILHSENSLVHYT